jgi:hypothetical protein
VAASRSTELISELPRQLVRDLRGLGGNERIAFLGAATVVASMLLPWYRAPVSSDLVQTGFGAFSFAEGALILVAAATTFLALECGGGYVPPRPLREWALFVSAGVWAALIVVYRMFDRPRFELAGIHSHYDLHYAIFVALAGAAIIVAAGLRMRPRERAKRPQPPD